MRQKIGFSPEITDRIKAVLPWPARLFDLSGIAALLVASYSTFQAMRATNWPTTEAEILKSEIKYIRQSDSAPRLDYQILYSYRVNDRSYTGSRVRFGGVDEFRWQLKDLLRRYRPGSRHAVHYNPDAPASSTLKAGFSAGLALLFVLGLGFTLGGRWLLCWSRSA